jgi:two-component system cell cycle sensor histidine kinase/response regulator CckA
MGEEKRQPDVLDRWLSGEGLASLDALTGGAPEVLGVMDRDFIIRYVNWTTPGITREQVIGGSVFNLVPAEYAEIARECFERVLRTGIPGSFETMYPGPDGVIVWVVRVGPIVHEGQVIGVFTINANVTEERRGAVDRDRFFSLSLDMLIVATSEGRLRRVNPAFGEALGYSISELYSKPFLDFIHPDDLPRTRAAYAEVLEGKQVTNFENRYLRRDGNVRVFSWRATVDPLTGDVYAVARDITDQRAAEAQLRHAQKMEAVGQLAGGIAHDFNNLMHAVLANVELALATTAPSPKIEQHLHEIEGAGQRAADLTKQLLAFSRRQPLHPVPIDLNQLIQGMLKLLQRLLPENIRIELKPGPELSSVSADRTQLEQVILNLCVNARDAMESGGTLTLATANGSIDAHDCELHPWAKPGNFVQLSVTDTGVGMSAEVLERVFDPFFTTRGQHGGTGLGLATVYGIVQQHGGLVHVYSEVGLGTTFKVYLPADERAPVAARVTRDSSADPLHGRETILLAEDGELVRGPMIQVLQGAGYRTLAASNGREAVQLLRDNLETIDLVVLDLVMPELGGLEAWEQMQALRPDLGVLFMSGYADSRSRERLPADAEVLEKPFRTQELLHRIREKLDGGGTPR